MRATARPVAILVLCLAAMLPVLSHAQAAFWSTTGTMTTSRTYPTATLLANGKVLVAGGYGPTFGSLFSAEIFDPATNKWTAINNMVGSRYFQTATLLKDGRVLVVGGLNQTQSPVGFAEIYDPSTGNWTQTGSNLKSRYNHTATLLKNGMVLVTGGCCDAASPLTQLNSAEVWDPATGQWSGVGSSAVAHSNGGAYTLSDGTVLEVAGFSYGSGSTTAVDLYNQTFNTWTALTGLNGPRGNFAGGLLTGDKVVVAGGSGGGCCAGVNTAELYDPATQSWQYTFPMNTVRNTPTSAVMQGGTKMLVAGGFTCCNDPLPTRDSAEIFDVTTKSWTTTASMAQARYGHAMVTLQDGSVLAIGGGVYSGSPYLNSAERYYPGTGPASPVSILIGSTPSPNGIVVSGANCSAGSYNTTATLAWVPGASCSVTAVVSPSYVFGSWNDGNTSNPRTFTAPATPSAYSFTLTSTGPPSIAATSGTPQAVSVNKTFPLPFVVSVVTASGTPVNGATITFSASTIGPSGLFAGSPIATAVTNSAGMAASPAFTANGIGGSYLVNATVAGAASPAVFSLTNTAAAGVVVTSGSGQSAAINSAFAAPLVATVKTLSGGPVSGVAVTFTPPVSGASGTFAGSNTVISDVSGVATSTLFKANSVAGTYTVSAVTSGAQPAYFTLTNNVGGPGSIVAISGTPQSATVSTPFKLLVVNVKDAGGNPVAGALITFASPITGASCTLAGTNVSTDGSGTAPILCTANATSGSYAVTAKVAGVATAATFALTNTSANPVAASIAAYGGTPQSATVSTVFASPLSAIVRDSSGNPVSGTVVTFAAPASGASGSFAGGVITATSNASGIAISAAFTANATAGSYTVTAAIAGVTNKAGFAMTNTAKVTMPASIVVTSGTPQSATVSTAFANPLVVTVKDSSSKAVSGVVVTFAAPTSGASGTFTGGVTTATTNASGIATSPVFTANATTGSYTVTASVAGVTAKANFALTNNAASTGGKTLVPTSYITTLGSSGGQSVSALGVQDQSGSTDTWNKYVEFDPKSGSTYVGYQTFTLPTTVTPASIKTIQVQANYKGPATGTTVWTWQIYNWTSGAWVTIGTNAGAPDWGSWKLLSFPASGTLSNYVRATDGAMMVQLLSNNAKDAAEIDYEAVVVTN
ncbi:MAG TPA: kelch repeat-containing protein [Terriglobales bacterium]|nr:kelch repeat-containing protein [Terriglobales bacterium]